MTLTKISCSYLYRVCQDWAAVQAARKAQTPINLDGDSLNPAQVIAVALYGVGARLSEDEAVRERITASVDFLMAELAAGKVVYGVNTGFGGSADTRTQDFTRLQSALLQLLNIGVLLPQDKGQDDSGSWSDEAAQTDLQLRSHALPPAIVRAMMLVRGNSLARGHSAVRASVVEALLQLLSQNMTPVVPLRGSISASGDLSTLSYVAGLLEGNPDIYVRAQLKGSVRYLPADAALRMAGLKPVRLQAKEGLGITNGTAPSCAAGCLAVNTAGQLAVLAQVLTAMGTEALAGTADNYDDFISQVRPHEGQREVAATIRKLLAGSKLASGADGEGESEEAESSTAARTGLAQDRYALRTSPQWIGPQLEDLALAARQVATELNATTDNPLIDAKAGRAHHGGNFQAMSVTSAMEKTTTALQNLGRLLFAQSSELVDGSRNRGLPPNLSADDPSTSFLCKGLDISMAAYQAELSYLARPVSASVQVAEMANQAVNSMALVAARYALEAAEVLSLMVATYLYVLCQALDLRVLQRTFHATALPKLTALYGKLVDSSADASSSSFSTADILAGLLERWDELAHLDLGQRGVEAAQHTAGAVLASYTKTSGRSAAAAPPDAASLLAFQDAAAECLSETYRELRDSFIAAAAPASASLSPATRVVYEYVRLELGIRLNRGIDDHPTLAAETHRANGHSHGTGDAGDGNKIGNGNDHESGREKSPHCHGARGTRTLGSMTSQIYMAVRNGELFGRVAAYCDANGLWEN